MWCRGGRPRCARKRRGGRSRRGVQRRRRRSRRGAADVGRVAVSGVAGDGRVAVSGAAGIVSSRRGVHRVGGGLFGVRQTSTRPVAVGLGAGLVVVRLVPVAAGRGSVKPSCRSRAALVAARAGPCRGGAGGGPVAANRRRSCRVGAGGGPCRGRAGGGPVAANRRWSPSRRGRRQGDAAPSVVGGWARGQTWPPARASAQMAISRSVGHSAFDQSSSEVGGSCHWASMRVSRTPVA